MPQTSMFVLMMNIWKVLMAVCHRLMSVQMRVLTSWRRPVRVDMLMMFIMFVLIAMLYQLMGVLVLMGFSKV